MIKLRRNLLTGCIAVALLGTAGAAQAQTWVSYDRYDWRHNPVGAVVASPFLALGAAVSPYNTRYYGSRHGYRVASYDPNFNANAAYYGGPPARSYLDAQARYEAPSLRTQLYVDAEASLPAPALGPNYAIPASERNIIEAEIRDHYWTGG